ncbi:MAG: glycoside hydrolase family 9 protein [Tannerellaceae bacterium]|jgi:hypothetical protein|nr:glycoside hydrolase family 9 protein [Tannerellaceae bacterium]
MKQTLLLILIASTMPLNPLWPAKLYNVQIVDKEIILVTFRDGEITFRDDARGASAYLNDNDETQNTLVTFGNPLNTAVATLASAWTISSGDDEAYGRGGLQPLNCYRKSKINGMGQFEWIEASRDYRYDYPQDHAIYLVLPRPMKDNCRYTVTINPATEADKTSAEVVFDIFNTRSEAIHTNIVGYMPGAGQNPADVYIWMGDGGHRDYTAFAGNKVYLCNTATGEKREAGRLGLWKESGADVGYYNFTMSPVWRADFSADVAPGDYRLVIEGIGSSDDFQVIAGVYKTPYDVSLKGYYYMRIGEDCMECVPVPRRPLYIPGRSPANTTVYITTMQPYHAEWETFSHGDRWDNPGDWIRYREQGLPVNDKAIGGHSDAYDWDRHLGHISNIYDMLLPYYITRGALSDDNCGIRESGNGIPDILDEARNEVDFWLNLRHGEGYSHGLTNPNSRNELFQAGNTTVAAWANAANAAMLAECFRIAGNGSLMDRYLDSAVIAFEYAQSRPDMMLDRGQDIGDGYIRGKDLRMMAAAYLYNLTGDVRYEDRFALDCEINTPTSVILDSRSRNQLWAVAAYLFTDKPVNHPRILDNIRQSVIHQAWAKEAGHMASRPSRRSTHVDMGYYHTEQNVHHTILAHAITGDPSEKAAFLSALLSEADWGLGRNPMNMIQMSTATTPLADKRSVINLYTAGRNDGTPGMHPGHTPYMNVDDWGGNMTMGQPSRMYRQSYPTPLTPSGSNPWGPEIKKIWPQGELYFETRYIYAHSEFTPQQTMRGKMALYGYLHALGKDPGAGQPPSPVTPISAGGATDNGIQLSNTGTGIHIACIEPPVRAEILTLDGRIMYSRTINDTSADIRSPKGIYILKISGSDGRLQSAKFAVK